MVESQDEETQKISSKYFSGLISIVNEANLQYWFILNSES